jgi:hypothetical protein
MRVAGLVVEGRSLTCPSPSSMSCHVRSARRARSAIRNSSPSEPMSRMNGIRSRSGGGWSPGASGVRGDQPTSARGPPGTHLGRAERLEAADDEAAGEIILAELAEPGRDPPRRRLVPRSGDIGGPVSPNGASGDHLRNHPPSHRRDSPRRSGGLSWQGVFSALLSSVMVQERYELPKTTSRGHRRLAERAGRRHALRQARPR